MNKSSLHFEDWKVQAAFHWRQIINQLNSMSINKSKEKQYAAVLFLTPASLVNKGFSS